MHIFPNDELVPKGYIDSYFQCDKDSRQSTSGSVFNFGSAVLSWRSLKQSYIVDSTMKIEYIVVSEVAKEIVWLRKFLMELMVVPLAL